MLDTKKGKYTHEENQRIIQKINDDFAQGIREKETLKELSRELNRGFAGIMSHVRKLRNQFPDRFPAKQKANRSRNDRMNSWTEAEEQLVIETVNRHLEQGKPLSTAISELERQLKRTQGAIYQRIYNLRHKYPERFKHMPQPRPRGRRRLKPWQIESSPSQQGEGSHSEPHTTPIQGETAASLEPSDPASLPGRNKIPTPSEEEMVLKAFEKRYGKLNNAARKKMRALIQEYGGTRVSIALFTLSEDKEFPAFILRFLHDHLERNRL